MIKPLDRFMDNRRAWRLGAACVNAVRECHNGWDPIDQGLQLLMELNKFGFDVIERAESFYMCSLCDTNAECASEGRCLSTYTR